MFGFMVKTEAEKKTNLLPHAEEFIPNSAQTSSVNVTGFTDKLTGSGRLSVGRGRTHRCWMLQA